MIPSPGGSSRTPRATTSSTASLVMNATMSERNCAPNSARRSLVVLGVHLSNERIADQRGIHLLRRALPDQDRRVVLAEILGVVRVENAALGVGRLGDQQQAVRYGARPGRTALMTSTSGLALSPSTGQKAVSSHRTARNVRPRGAPMLAVWTSTTTPLAKSQRLGQLFLDQFCE